LEKEALMSKQREQPPQQEPHAAITFRHILYGVLFYPLTPHTARQLANAIRSSPAYASLRSLMPLNELVNQMREEIAHPTGQIQMVLPGLEQHSEKELRAFLSMVAESLSRGESLE